MTTNARIANPIDILATPKAEDVLIKILSQPLENGEYLDILIDPKANFLYAEAAQELLDVVHRNCLYKTALTDELFENNPEDAPYLLRFRHQYDQPYDLMPRAKLEGWLESVIALGQTETEGNLRSVCAFVISRQNQEDLAAQLSQSLNPHLPDAQSTYLRFFDPRVTHWLPNLLDKSRYGTIRNGISRWYYPHWSGRWLSLPSTSEADAARALGLTLASEASFALPAAISHALQLLSHVYALPGQALPDLPLPYDPADEFAISISTNLPKPVPHPTPTALEPRHAAIETELMILATDASRNTRFTRTRDLGALLALTYCHGEKVFKHPDLYKCIALSRDKDMSFQDVAQQRMGLRIQRREGS